MRRFFVLMFVFLLLCGCAMSISAMWREDAVIAGPNEQTTEVLTWPSFFLEKTGSEWRNDDYYEKGCTNFLRQGTLTIYLNDVRVNIADFLYDINNDFVALQLKTGDVIRVVISSGYFDGWSFDILTGGQSWRIDGADLMDNGFDVTFTVVDSVYITADCSYL